jgi:ketol-acid reductoisomerase
MRDSGLDISYALRAGRLRASFESADNGFTVGTYEDLIPTADLVCNLTPDKQHSGCDSHNAINEKVSLLASSGFNIVGKECKFVKDITVIMCSQMSSSEREEYKRGFAYQLCCYPERVILMIWGLAQAKHMQVATGGHKAGV